MVALEGKAGVGLKPYNVMEADGMLYLAVVGGILSVTR
jgi:hypothetical protein